MIETHRLNSEWWNAPVGLIDDGEIPTRDELARYAWVEYRAPYDASSALQLHALGFIHAESYVRCRIALARITSTPSVDTLRVQSVNERNFDYAPFEGERFDLLPGITAGKLRARYDRYLANVINANPQTCLEIANEHGPQGWFLSEPKSGDTIQLSLATLHRDATISGAHLYHRALLEYARQGYRLGTATFTVRHADVMNIYARLGAVFVEPLEIWLWIHSRSASQT